MSAHWKVHAFQNISRVSLGFEGNPEFKAQLPGKQIMSFFQKDGINVSHPSASPGRISLLVIALWSNTVNLSEAHTEGVFCRSATSIGGRHAQEGSSEA